ncbi:hypothetical protein IAR55_006398 [Kwoniella newhampshirensis]|uniref:Uncharacterized protein n=1 Tax=Kwoniella newhampshirensis TaxID=1651941 RepID=A0AAW0YDZ3_9TREE
MSSRHTVQPLPSRPWWKADRYKPVGDSIPAHHEMRPSRLRRPRPQSTAPGSRRAASIPYERPVPAWSSTASSVAIATSPQTPPTPLMGLPSLREQSVDTPIPVAAACREFRNSKRAWGMALKDGEIGEGHDAGFNLNKRSKHLDDVPALKFTEQDGQRGFEEKVKIGIESGSTGGQDVVVSDENKVSTKGNPDSMAPCAVKVISSASTTPHHTTPFPALSHAVRNNKLSIEPSTSSSFPNLVNHIAQLEQKAAMVGLLQKEISTKAEVERTLAERMIQVKRFSDENTDLKSQMESLRFTINEKTAALERMVARRKSVMSNLSESAETKKQLSGLEEELRTVRREMQGARVEKSKVEKKNEELRGELYVIKAEKAELFNELEDERSGKTKKWTTLGEEVEKEKTKLDSNILAWATDKNVLESRIQAAEKERDDLRKARATLQVELNTTKVSLQDTNRQVDEARRLLAQVNDSHHRTAHVIDQLVAEKNHLSRELASHIKILEAGTLDREANSKKVQELEADLAKLRQELSEEEAARTGFALRLKFVEKDARQKIVLWQEKVNDLKIQVEIKTNAIAVIRVEYENELQKRNDEVERLERDVKELMGAN